MRTRGGGGEGGNTLARVFCSQALVHRGPQNESKAMADATSECIVTRGAMGGQARW